MAAAQRLLAQSHQALANLAAMAPQYLTQGQLCTVLQNYLSTLIRGTRDEPRLPAPLRQKFFAMASAAVAALLQQVQAPVAVLERG